MGLAFLDGSAIDVLTPPSQKRAVDTRCGSVSGWGLPAFQGWRLALTAALEYEDDDANKITQDDRELLGLIGRRRAASICAKAVMTPVDGSIKCTSYWA